MRKAGLVIGLVGAVLSGKVYASELPDFREYVRRDTWSGHLFRLILVDEKRSIVGRGGYLMVVGMPDGGYCGKHGLSAYTKVLVGGMEVEKEYPKNIGTWGQIFGKDRDFYHSGYCKDKEGNVAVSYRGHIVEHPPSKVNDVILPKSAEKKIAEIKSYEDMLKAYKGKQVEKGIDIYRIEGYYMWSSENLLVGDSSFNPFVALGICRKLGGEFYRIGAEGEVRFVDYV